ncbi:hypothetical protein KY284_023772 [Solanum tuberosum]|nr:hypothetical protein KY284_023772 [Solanum tuberosum]
MIPTNGLALDDLTARVESCETIDCSSIDVTFLKVYIIGLHRDVDELKSTYILILWGGVDILEDPISEIPRFNVISEIPLTTMTGDATEADEDSESDIPEMGTKELETREKAVYQDLENLDGYLLWEVTKASLRDMSMISSIGSKPMKDIVAQPSRARDE